MECEVSSGSEMLQCSQSRLDGLHEFLRLGFGRDVLGDISIDIPPSVSAQYWRKPSFNGQVEFVLKDEINQVYAHTQTRSCPVAQLTGFADDAIETGWVSWREVWDKSGSALTLAEAAFTFYWGRPYNVNQSLFRAEWTGEQICCKHSGHPHWHFDHEPFGAEMLIGSLHLGMAGWEHEGEAVANWQRFPGGTDELLTWASRTLQYSRLQLLNYPPTLPAAETE